MKKILLSLLMLGIFQATSFAQIFPTNNRNTENDPYYGDYVHNYTHKIQIALILDVSGSMDGLIEQAKSQLWTVVNGIMFDESMDGYPQIEIALMEYGNSRNHRDGYMRILVPFTSNLDWIADELFTLRTGGNREYGPRAVSLAINSLEWTRSRRDLRLLYIAGNESFQQGYTDFRNVARQARNNDIIVNTIFCGDFYYGRRLGWDDAARLANGDYLNIEQNFRPHYDDDVYSQRLYSLNSQLNGTYIPYGRRGNECFIRQRDLDRRAGSFGRGYASQRYITKSTGAYMNPDWDLVDAVATGRVRIDEIPEQDLPSEMRRMSINQRRDFIQNKLQQRKRVQSEMRQLGSQQIKKARTMPAKTEGTGPVRVQPNTSSRPQTLDQAIIKSTRHHQEVKKGTYKRPPVINQPVRPKKETYQRQDTYRPRTDRWQKPNSPVRKPSQPVRTRTSPPKKVYPQRQAPKPVRVQTSPGTRAPQKAKTNTPVRVKVPAQKKPVKPTMKSPQTPKVKSPSRNIQAQRMELRRRN